MSEFRPITTLEDLFSQDEAEIVAGYWAGRRGDPEPGNAYSRGYWHGYRNGVTDAGRRRIATDQKTLRVLTVSRILHSHRLQ